MTRNDLLTLAQRLREYERNPHHINPMSEAFSKLVIQSADALSSAAADYAALEAENARLVERTGYLVEFAQQMARQQGEPYYRLLAKAALKKWSEP